MAVRLCNLMIDHGIGVTRATSYEVKRLDSDYFFDVIETNSAGTEFHSLILNPQGSAIRIAMISNRHTS